MIKQGRPDNFTISILLIKLEKKILCLRKYLYWFITNPLYCYSFSVLQLVQNCLSSLMRRFSKWKAKAIIPRSFDSPVPVIPPSEGILC